MTERNEGMSLQDFMQLSMSYVPSRIISAGVQLRVFDRIRDGAGSVTEVARVAGASERGMRMLLDALGAMGMLRKESGRYELTPFARQHLLSDSPDYVGATLESDHLWDAWTHLTDSIRSGKPWQPVERQDKAEDFFPRLVRGLHVTNSTPARNLAVALLGDEPGRELRVLDVACGSGIWGISVAEAGPNVHVTYQDYPGVLKTTEHYVERHGLKARSDYLEGNLRHVTYGTEVFDLALLGNIAHSEGAEATRELFGYMHLGLRRDGRVVVIDMLPNADRTGPLFPLTFALNMLVNTEEGDTFTLGEYTEWLHEAGFARVETVDIGLHSPAVLGVKE